MAAVLACGPDAALSHRSAAALWRILPRWHTPTEVTAPTTHRLGIHVHRSPTPADLLNAGFSNTSHHRPPPQEQQAKEAKRLREILSSQSDR